MTSSLPPSSPAAPPPFFSPYQRFVAGLLAFLQFAVILDFMIMSPLGAVIMPDLQITPQQFGLIVSAYAFSAGLTGLLTAGFADRFDRKKLLLFFYTGFVLSTLWCGLAPSFEALLMARIVTGVFGGVIGSVVMAIATDLFPLHLRGRVMGVIQTAFAASQVLGLPVGLYLSNHWGWHAPFIALAGFGLLGGLLMAWRLQPVTGHLGQGPAKGAFSHLLQTVALPRHQIAFVTTALLTTGGFMLMPFSSAFTVHTLGIPLESLPTIYLITGLCTIVIGPLVGRLADSLGTLKVFMGGTGVTIVMVIIYTHLQAVPMPVVIGVNVLLFAGIFSRLIPFQALVSEVPAPAQRGAFNAVNAAIQQLAGGLSSLVAGQIVAFGPDGKLLHFPVVGYVVVGASVITATLVWRIHRDLHLAPPAQPAPAH